MVLRVYLLKITIQTANKKIPGGGGRVPSINPKRKNRKRVSVHAASCAYFTVGDSSIHLVASMVEDCRQLQLKAVQQTKFVRVHFLYLHPTKKFGYPWQF